MIEFEANSVHRIQAEQGWEQPYVGFRHAMAHEELAIGEDPVDAIEGREEVVVGRFVHILIGRETRLVGTIRNVHIYVIIQFIDLIGFVVRVQVDIYRMVSLIMSFEFRKYGPHHTEYICTFVVHNRLGFLINQYRDGLLVGDARRLVDVLDIFLPPKDGVDGATWESRVTAVDPHLTVGFELPQSSSSSAVFVDRTPIGVTHVLP